MDYSEVFGSVSDTGKGHKQKKRPEPKTEIGRFYREHCEVITHWCKPCKRWHGATCFHESRSSEGGSPSPSMVGREGES